MGQQTIDVHINPSEDLRMFRMPVVPDVGGPSLPWLLLGRIRSLLRPGLWLLIGFFYLATFFAQHKPFEATVLGILGVSVLAGLLKETSAPAAVPVLLFEDVAHVTVATLAVQFAIQVAGMTSVQAAVVVGILAWLSGRLNLLSERVRPATLYCGAFVGMTSSQVLPSLGWLTLAGVLAGIFYSLANHFCLGVGGNLGTMAFAGTAITVALACSAGLYHPNLTAASVDPALQVAVLGVAIVSVPLTYWLTERLKFGAVFASAVPSAVLVFGVKLLDTSWQLKVIPLGTAWFGASFAGMTSVDRLAGRSWTLPFIGLIYGFLSIQSGPRLYGFGGGMGTTALVSVLAVFGIARLVGGKPIPPHNSFLSVPVSDGSKDYTSMDSACRPIRVALLELSILVGTIVVLAAQLFRLRRYGRRAPCKQRAQSLDYSRETR